MENFKELKKRWGLCPWNRDDCEHAISNGNGTETVCQQDGFDCCLVETEKFEKEKIK